MLSCNINFRDIILEVEYKYEEGEKEIRNYGDGSGYPGSPSTVEIFSVKHCGESLMTLMTEETIEELESEILKQHEGN